MFKRIKGFFNDIKDINFTLQNIYNKLNNNTKINNTKTARKPSHAVWLMNKDETKCILANDISVFKTVIKVNGLDFDRYESEEKAKEEFTEICNWIASSNPSGTGIYQLTN